MVPHGHVLELGTILIVDDFEVKISDLCTIIILNGFTMQIPFYGRLL